MKYKDIESLKLAVFILKSDGVTEKRLEGLLTAMGWSRKSMLRWITYMNQLGFDIGWECHIRVYKSKSTRESRLMVRSIPVWMREFNTLPDCTQATREAGLSHTSREIDGPVNGRLLSGSRV